MMKMIEKDEFIVCRRERCDFYLLVKKIKWIFIYFFKCKFKRYIIFMFTILIFMKYKYVSLSFFFFLGINSLIYIS